MERAACFPSTLQDYEADHSLTKFFCFEKDDGQIHCFLYCLLWHAMHLIIVYEMKTDDTVPQILAVLIFKIMLICFHIVQRVGIHIDKSTNKSKECEKTKIFTLLLFFLVLKSLIFAVVGSVFAAWLSFIKY